MLRDEVCVVCARLKFRFRCFRLMSESLFYRLDCLKFHNCGGEVFSYNTPVCEHSISIGFLDVAADVVAIVKAIPIK